MLGRLGGRIMALASATLVVVAVPTAAGAASHAGPDISVGPKQYFTGLVFGRTKQDVIDVVCAGIAPTGHPFAGQSAEVGLLVPPVNPTAGYTGTRANRIRADLIWSQGTVTHVVAIATFTAYSVKMQIPTNITVPCGGSGVMSFAPLPTSKSAKSAMVNVTFESPGA